MTLQDPEIPSQRHILILIHSLDGGGAERVTVNLAAMWAAAGDQVTIATFKGREPISYEIPMGVRLMPLDIAGETSGPLNAVLVNLRRIWRVRQLLRKEHADIAIGMMTTSAILIALARRKETFLIGSERTYPPSHPLGRAWELIRKKAYALLDMSVAQTQETQAWLLRNTGARRAIVIPNHIQLPLPQREPYLKVSDVVSAEKKILLSVGRAVPEKGFDRLIEAFGRVAGNHPEWRLVILGEGPLRPALEKQAQNDGLEGCVILPGWAGNLADWYAASDVYVMTSRREGFPNALLEAMAHGCAVVSVDCDTGPRDLIRHETNGLLVPQNDPVALSNALEMLMKDEAQRSRLGTNALNVRETYSPEKINALWQGLFNLKRSDTPIAQQEK